MQFIFLTRIKNMPEIKAINIKDKFNAFEKTWTPHIIGELNDQYVKLCKLQDNFVCLCIIKKDFLEIFKRENPSITII